MNLSSQAKLALDRYLRTLRLALSQASEVDQKEVEEEIRAHIERELSGHAGVVGWTRLQLVLEQLGSPLQWVPEESLSAWQRCKLRLRVGPEAWRLAYLSLALWMVSGTAFLLHGPWLAAILLFAAFVCARASAAIPESIEDDETRRTWLTAPALLLVYAGIGFVLLFGVLLPIWIFAEQVLRLEALKPRFPEAAIAVARRILAIGVQPHDLTQTAVAVAKVGVWVLGPLGIWWSVLGAFTICRTRWMRALFHPLSELAARRLGVLLFVSGLAVSLCGIMLALIKHVRFDQLQQWP